MKLGDLVVDVRVPGEPVSKGRPRVVKGNAFTPPETAAAEQEIGWRLKRARDMRDVDGDALFVLHVDAFCKRGTRRDGDNILKLIGDAGNGIVWLDDQQICEWRVRVWRGCPHPQTHIQVWRLDPAVWAERVS